jgi:hypothetical protein
MKPQATTGQWFHCYTAFISGLLFFAAMQAVVLMLFKVLLMWQRFA